ncbi:MAG: hypothetical protein K2O69_05340 [Odoribacter sp.]|nr:hypothetical protein [Odoribacter sp.]
MKDRFTIALERLKSGDLENTSYIVNDLEGAPFIMNGQEYRLIRCYLHEYVFSNNIDLSKELKCRYVDLKGNSYCDYIDKLLPHAQYIDPVIRNH